MSITLNSLAALIYRLQGQRIASQPRKNTVANRGDDVTRTRESFHDEQVLLHNGENPQLEAARAQRDLLRNRINIL